MIRILLPQRWSTSSSVECSSDLFAKPRSLRKEWCGFMDDVFFHQSYRRGNGCFLLFFLLTNVDVPKVTCKSVFEYWCQWLGMIWGAGSNWNSIEIDTSIHMPFVNDIWMIRKKKKISHWWMDGGFSCLLLTPTMKGMISVHPISNCQAPTPRYNR